MHTSSFINKLFPLLNIEKRTEQILIYKNLKKSVAKHTFVKLINALPKEQKNLLKEKTHSISENKRIPASKKFIKRFYSTEEYEKIQKEAVMEVMQMFFKQLWKNCPKENRTTFKNIIEENSPKEQ